MKEDAYKSLDFLEMMIAMGMNCEKCGDEPSFPDKWWFLPNPDTAGAPVVCPKCMEKHARGE